MAKNSIGRYFTEESYGVALRIAMFVLAIGGWIVSVGYSVRGFGFKVAPEIEAAVESGNASWEQVSTYLVGFIFALTITVLELTFNQESKRLSCSVFAFAVGAYAYGWWSNFAGLQANDPAAAWTSEWFFRLGVSAGFEVLPERMFVYAFTGSWIGGDAFESMWDGVVRAKNAVFKEDAPSRPQMKPSNGYTSNGIPKSQGPGYQARMSASRPPKSPSRDSDDFLEDELNRTIEKMKAELDDA